MGVFRRSVLIAFLAASDGATTIEPATEAATEAAIADGATEAATTTTAAGSATTAVVGTIWPAPRTDCDDYTGAQCCDVNGNETNAECWANVQWAKAHMGEEAHFDWYSEYGVTKENSASLTNAQMQCVLWEIAKAKKDLMDKYPSSNHHCPRPCLPPSDEGVECIAGAKNTEKAEEPKDDNSLSIPLWAIILISLVAIGAIIAGVIFYLSNDKSPQKKKKKRGGITTPAPQKKAPEPEPPAPVVATAAPIYTTAAPLTYTAAAPVSAGSFVYAPQPIVTTAGVQGSVYQAGPVVTHATPIATSQPIYQLQPGGASVM